jgi:acyl-CoA reductase-like NAD-dependent aldehyde dehydrogenase
MATTKTNRKRSGELDAADRNAMPDKTFAFPRLRKEPLSDASHVRNAIARFDQVRDATDTEREEAFRRIKRAAKRHGVEMTESSWHDLGKPARTANKTARTADKTARTADKTARTADKPAQTAKKSVRSQPRSERSRDELYAEAKRRDIKGRSAMTKAELVQALGGR